MATKKSSSGRALVRTVASNHIGDAIFDLLEVAIDGNLSEGVLRDIPIAGTMVKLARAGISISEELFIKKLQRFLSDLSEIPIKDREKLLEQYPDSSDKQAVLGENLLLALERLDDVKKPAILARFFSAFVRLEINYLTFTRLGRALEKFNMELLPNLTQFYIPKEPFVASSEEIIHELSLAGLVTVSLQDSGTFSGMAAYRFSELGKAFLRIGFDVEASPQKIADHHSAGAASERLIVDFQKNIARWNDENSHS